MYVPAVPIPGTCYTTCCIEVSVDLYLGLSTVHCTSWYPRYLILHTCRCRLLTGLRNYSSHWGSSICSRMLWVQLQRIQMVAKPRRPRHRLFFPDKAARNFLTTETNPTRSSLAHTQPQNSNPDGAERGESLFLLLICPFPFLFPFPFPFPFSALAILTLLHSKSVGSNTPM
ncbi:hypothetical protein DFH06DRAFT_284029 [Mycena polygramma]|nr:hypothetical protein DFH06DRAFT_284029 [Mycena polygramma]